MGHKDIKRIIKKQLKIQYPNWKRLKRKIKREIAKKVLAEVTADYDFNSEITVPTAELLAGASAEVDLDDRTRALHAPAHGAHHAGGGGDSRPRHGLGGESLSRMLHFGSQIGARADRGDGASGEPLQSGEHGRKG